MPGNIRDSSGIPHRAQTSQSNMAESRKKQPKRRENSERSKIMIMRSLKSRANDKPQLARTFWSGSG